MSQVSLACGVATPPGKEQIFASKALRVTAIVLGVIALMVGVLILCNVQGLGLGKVWGGCFAGGGAGLIMVAAALQCVRDRSVNENTKRPPFMQVLSVANVPEGSTICRFMYGSLAILTDSADALSTIQTAFWQDPNMKTLQGYQADRGLALYGMVNAVQSKLPPALNACILFVTSERQYTVRLIGKAGIFPEMHDSTLYLVVGVVKDPKNMKYSLKDRSTGFLKKGCGVKLMPYFNPLNENPDMPLFM